MSRLIHKKWWPCEVIEARDLKFCMGPYFIYTHAVQKGRLDLRTFKKKWYSLIHILYLECKFRMFRT